MNREQGLFQAVETCHNDITNRVRAGQLSEQGGNDAIRTHAILAVACELACLNDQVASIAAALKTDEKEA